MRIQHNIMAMNSYRNLSGNNGALGKNLEKLSSGYRINRAGDDAAGLAISEKMRAQIAGLDQAQKNAQSGINLVKTAEGALTEVHDMLNRMVTLASQSANGTYTATDREKLQAEIDALTAEIDRIAENSNFNGTKLLNGDLGLSTSDALSSTTGSVNMSDGITINAPVDGKSDNQTYELNFGANAVFGESDTVNFKIGTNDLTFTYGTNFTGTNLEDQMTSLADAINNNATFKGYEAYDASVLRDDDGNATGIQLTAKEAGTATTTIGAHSTDGLVEDARMTLGNPTVTPAANGGTKTASGDSAWKLLDGTTAYDLQLGDKVKFAFKVNGQDLTVTLEAGVDFQLGVTDADTVTHITKALQSDTLTFDDTESTKTFDESKLLVKDYFQFAGNTNKGGTAAVGEIQVKAAAGLGADYTVGVADAKIICGENSYDPTTGNTLAGTEKTVTADVGAVYAFSGHTAEKWEQAGIDKNMVAGEQFKVSGTLKDGRTFEITLTASEDGSGANEFALGSDLAGTMTNLTKALSDPLSKAQVTITDGEETSTMNAYEVFGTGKEYTVGYTSNKLTLENVAGCKGMASTLDTAKTGFVLHDTMEGTLEEAVTGGLSKAQNSMTFDASKVEEGTTVTIDGKTYEFVTAEANKSKAEFEAVVVNGLGDTATSQEIADALKGKLADANNKYTSAAGKKYDVGTNNGTVTLTSESAGADYSALGVAANAGERATTSVTFQTTEVGTISNPKQELNVKVGDAVTINGKVYEFTDGVKRTKDENAIGVSLQGITTAAQAAAKLADVVEANDASINTTVENGTVIMASTYNVDADVANGEDPYAAPTVELPKDSNGLTLQIGADSVETIDVAVDSMKAADLGIENLDISGVKSANAAIDTIKAAIEKVSVTRGNLGAVQNRLEHTINNLGVMEENITDAEANIRDTDIADEMMNYTKNNILIQSAQAMLAQANQVPQGVLQLMG